MKRLFVVGLLLCIPMSVWSYFAYTKYHDIDNKVESPIQKAVEAKTIEGSLKHLNKVMSYLKKSGLHKLNDQKLWRNLNDCYQLLEKVYKTNATKREVVLTRMLIKEKLMEGGKTKNTNDMMFGKLHVIFTILGGLLGIVAAIGIICMFLAVYIPIWAWLDSSQSEIG